MILAKFGQKFLKYHIFSKNEKFSKSHIFYVFLTSVILRQFNRINHQGHSKKISPGRFTKPQLLPTSVHILKESFGPSPTFIVPIIKSEQERFFAEIPIRIFLSKNLRFNNRILRFEGVSGSPVSAGAQSA